MTNGARRGDVFKRLEQARAAADALQLNAETGAAETGTCRYRGWQRALSAFVAATLFVGPITVTVEAGRDAAGVLAAGSHRIDDDAWRAIQDIASLHVRFAMQAAEAAPIVDPTAPITFQPQIVQSTGTGGGVPVVNITAPNAAGISLNQYQTFNIDAAGLILNNSLQSGTSLTGGTVAANPNLNGRTASVILNQVTSTGAGYASVLAGPLEVFGAAATVIIANPNGIAVRGAGFTNTIGVTLTTGTPQFLTGPGGTATGFTNGQAIAYDVKGGHIQIEGNAGVNGPGSGIEGTVGTIDLIGETVGINAPLYAGTRINVIAGDQTVKPSTVDAATGTTYSTSANGSANTAGSVASASANQGYAIDATAFGAMTAGQISMVGTSAGMGVRADAGLSATTGNLTLSSNGDLTVASHTAQQDVSMTSAGNVTLAGTGVAGSGYTVNAAGDVVSNGTVQSGADLSITAGNNVALAGQSTAQNNVTLSAGRNVSLTGSLASGKAFNATVAGAFSVPGSLLVGTDATLSSGTLDVPGVVIVQQNGTLTTQGDLTGSGSIAFGQKGTLSSGRDVNITGKLLSNDLQVNAANSATFADVQAGGAFGVVANGLAGNGNVTFNGNAASVGNASAQAANDVVVNGTLAGGAQVALTAQRNVTVATSGAVQSVGDLSMTATTGDVSSSGAITSGGALSAQAGHDIALTGTTNAVRDTTLNAGNDLSINGAFAGQGNATLTAGHDLNVGGTSGISKDVTATAGHDLALSGALQGNNVALSAANAITLNNLQANGTLSATTTNSAGSIAVNGTVASLSSGTLASAGTVVVNGALKTAGALGVTAGTDTTIAGTVTSNGDMTLTNTTGSLTSTGQIQSGGNLVVNAAQSIDLGTGATSALSDMTLTAGRDVVMNGTLVGQGNGIITAGGAISGNAALAFGLAANLSSTGDTALTGSLRGATIQTNAGGSGTFANVQAGSTIAMSATNDLSVTGALVGGATAQLSAGRDLNIGGTTTVTGDTTLQGERDVNVTGTVNGQGNGTVTAGRDIIGNGTLAFQQATVLSAAGNVAQTGLVQGQAVQVSAGGDLAVNNAQSASSLTLSAGTSGVGNLSVNGLVSAAQAITATAFGNIAVANGGKLAAGSTLGIGALNDITVNGAVESVGDMTLNAQLGSLSATGGINSGGALTITTGLDLSLGASTTSIGDMTLSAGRSATLNGTLVGGGNGLIVAGQDILGPGTQSFVAAAVLNAQRDIALTGLLQANSIQAIAGNNATLHDVTSATTLAVTANGNAGGGDVAVTGTASAGGAVTLTAARDVLVQGSLGSSSTVGLTAQRNVTIDGSVNSTGNLSIVANSGNASLNGTATTSGALSVTSGLDTRLGGQTNATGSIDVEAARNIALDGSLAGQAAGTLSAGQDITGAGTAAFGQAAGVAANNNIALTGSLQGATVNVIAGNNAGLGTVQALTGDLNVTAYGSAGQGDVTLAGAATAYDSTSFVAARDVSVAGAINSINATSLSAGRNVSTVDIGSGSDITLSATNGSITTGNAATNANLWVDAGGSASLGTLNAAGLVAMQSLGFDGIGDVAVRGALTAGNTVVVGATRDASFAGAVTTGGALSVSAGRNVTAASTVSANADTTLAATTGNLAVNGSLSTVGNLAASAGGSLALAGGLINGNTTLSSGGAMTLTNGLWGLGTATLTSGGSINGGGSLTVAGDIGITSGAGITLGAIEGAGRFTASTVGDMSFGATTAVGDVTAKSTSGSVAFSGLVQSGGVADLEAARNVTAAGGISSMGNVTVKGTAGNVNVAGVSSNGDVSMAAGQTLTVSGPSTVVGDFALTGGNVTLSGTQSGSKNITVAAQNTLDASHATLVSSQNLQVNGKNVTLGNAIVGGALNAQATNQLTLAGSAVDVVGAATLSSQGGLYNASNVLAGGALTVTAPNITNAAGASLASTSTTSITATNFTNAGLVNGKTTNVTVAGALSNVGGSLMGLNSLTINTGTLNNQNGLIFAGDPNTTNTPTTGDLSLTINGGGSAFANASGQLLAQRNLTLGAVNAALDPSQGTISQGGQLSITAGSINVAGTWNYGGQGVSIYGINGITNTGTMSGTAPLTISTNGTFANYGNVKGNDVTFNGSLYNVANAVMHAGDVLTLNGSVTNRGTVESAGNVVFNGGGNFDNQYGTTEANGNITLNTGGTVYNTAGSITAAGNINISAGAVINDALQGASQTQTQLVGASADSSLVTNIVIGTLTSSGCSGSTHGDCIFYTGTSTATINTLEPDLANNTIQVEIGAYNPCFGSSDCQNVEVGNTNGGGQTQTIALPGIDRTTTSPGAVSPGVIAAGGSVNITTGLLSNAGSTISAGLDVNLNLQSLNNAPIGNATTTTVDVVDQAQLNAFMAQLNALGSIGIYGTSSVGISGTVIPESYVTPNATANVPPSATSTDTYFGGQGQIIAGRNLTLSGGNLVNGGLLYAGNNVNVSGAQSFSNQGQYNTSTSTQPGCATGVSGTQCAAGTSLRGSNPTTTSFSYAQQSATVYAGNDLVISAGQISNTYGTLLAGHDIVIGGVGTTATSTTPASSLTNTSGNIIAGNNVTLNVSGAVTNTLPPPVPVHENYGSKEAYSGCMTAGGYKESYCEGYVDQQSGDSSVISAGNNLQINAGTLTNIGSLIAAGNNATISVAGPVVNEAQTLNAYWHSHWVQETGAFSSDKRHDVWACGSAAECTALYGSAYTNAGGTINPPQPVVNIAATIQAPNLSISSNGVIENVGNVLGTSVRLTGQSLINGITTANTYTPRVNGPSQVISLSPVNLPGLKLGTTGAASQVAAGQASYVAGVLGGSGTTLGPQELLSALPANLQPSSTLFYYNPEAEDLMLQQAALKQTGQASFIGGLSYDRTSGLSVTDQEKAILYENALDYAKQNSLQLGVALSQAQINELSKPMLWYVEQTVPDPGCVSTGVVTCKTVTALMPQVYLPANTSALSAGGNIIGQDVTLDFNQNGHGSILNTGNVSALNTLAIDTSALTNRANQVDVGHIWQYIEGEGYSDTTGTQVQPGGFMSAANMDLNVQTLSQIGGALQILAQDGTIDQAGTQQFLGSLQQKLGAGLTQTTLSDALHTSFTAQGGFGPESITAMAFAVVVAVMTYGAASAFIGGTLGTTAGSTFAAATDAATAGLGNIALSAGIAGFASSAASQLTMTGTFNLTSAFEAAAVAAITAGLTNGITYNSSSGLGFTTSPLPLAGQTSSLAMLAGVNPAIGNTANQATSTTATLGTRALAMLAEAGISSGVSTAIEGGSFGNAFKNALVGEVAAAVAYKIGDLANEKGSLIPVNSPQYILTHAVLGCAASAAEGTGCVGGAIGGATSALIAPNLVELAGGAANLTNEQRAIIVGASTLFGGLAAGLAGQNAQAGAMAAQNEALNNSTGTHDKLGHLPPGEKDTVSILPQKGTGDEGGAGAAKGAEPEKETVGAGPLMAGAAGAATKNGIPSSLSGLAEPTGIRFTQSSISSTFSDGSSLLDAIGALRSGVLSPSDLPPIRVYEQDGLIYTLDNRRLFVALQAGTMVNITPATTQQVTSQGWKFTTPNQGCIICIRGVPK